MKILVTAKYVNGTSYEGGSSRFMKCLYDELVDMGHEVMATNEPEGFMYLDFDLIICSHNLNKIKQAKCKKIFISHGLINAEVPSVGADRYVSISDEVRKYHLKTTGIDSEVIGQPIKIGDIIPSNKELKNILIIRVSKMKHDPFAFLSERYNVRMSDMDTPIEDQIKWADLCITIGRGALESMAQGKPVIIADNRSYMGAIGDGYVRWDNIRQISRYNFSGRRYAFDVTREWLENELKKYDPEDAIFLHKYIRRNHDAKKIVSSFLSDSGHITPPELSDYSKKKIAFGVMINDIQRLDMVLRQSEINGDMHFVKAPESATKGLNKLLDVIEGEGNDVAVLTHQDMYYRNGWLDQVRSQLSLLPDSWVVAGIIGKDMEGLICGKFHDMRIPLYFNTSHIHEFPHPACCFDECCIIVNLEKGFRFDESLDGFDLYGTLCALQAFEMGGTAWVIDAFAEHYCMRPFSWVPDDKFINNYKMLFDKYENLGIVDSTAIGLPREKIKFMTSA